MQTTCETTHSHHKHSCIAVCVFQIWQFINLQIVGVVITLQEECYLIPIYLPCTGPQLSLSINPVTSYVLDTDLYNTFVIQCVADVPDDVLSLKQFTWRIISKDSQTLGIISHNNTEGFMINQTDYPDSKVSVSELTGVLDMAGSYMITCDAVLDILEDSNQPLSTMEYDLIARSEYICTSLHVPRVSCYKCM